MDKVGILYICTGRFDVFWEEFHKTCEEYFLPSCEKTYYVFTDSDNIESSERVKKIHTDMLPFPLPTLLRYHSFLKAKELLDVDYLFFFNANSVFSDRVTSDEFLPNGKDELLAVRHYWQSMVDMNSEGSQYVRNPESTAYIKMGDGENYLVGGVMGGRREAFLRACQVMRDNIDADLKKRIIVKWWDEPHWNRYLLGRNDVRILDDSFCYPEGWVEIHGRKITILRKDKSGGERYLRGGGEHRDGPLSSDYYYGHSCHVVGDSYYHGSGIFTKDDKKAFDYWLKGAESGDLQCMKNVAWAYSDGIGCEANKGKEKFWSAKVSLAMYNKLNEK